MAAGVSYGPSIVTTGLSLVLDAANSRSYPGTGNTWYDLSGSGNNASGIGVSYSSSNSGCMVFNGANYFTVPPINFAANNFTIEMWIRPSSLATINEIIQTGSTNSTNNSYNIVLGYPSIGEISYFLSSNGNSWDMASGVAIGSSLNTSQWYHAVLSRVGSTFTPYLNGNMVGTTTLSAGSLYNYNSNLTIGTYVNNGTPGGYYYGYMSVIRMYKGVGLTQQQVQQNFNACRGRFGL